MNYYNEWDKFAAEWLKELIKEGLIPNGEVDTRSIADVEQSDLKGFTQCHFFAGIGGWSRALQLAGWSPDRPVWTGSPPCQPFSVAGKQQGTDDERHLWPVWFNLVRECRPSIIFGEQVAAAIRHGWLDSLQKDLEAENYACAAAVLPASGVGALHKRDRLWIVAHAISDRSQGRVSGWQNTRREIQYGQAGRETERRAEYAGNDSLADSENPGQCSDGGPVQQDQWHNTWGSCKAVHRGIEHAGSLSKGGSMGDTEYDGLHGSEVGRSIGSGEDKGGLLEPQRSDTDIWAEPRIIYCRDGKYRPIPTEPEVFPLAHGIPNRVGILRGAGNAIVPQVAAEIIRPFV